jgi:hypothetical protein
MYTSPARQKLNLYDQSDAVGKFRVSNPQALIDTDFEYGLQGTKWEILELVNGYPSAGYRPSEPAYAGNSGPQGIASIVGSPNQVGLGTGGFALNGTMRVTVLNAPASPFTRLNPVTVKFSGTSTTLADTTDGTGVITSVISPTVFEYKANTNTLVSTFTNVVNEQTIIYTGQWLSSALLPVSRLVTYGDSCSAAISTSYNQNYFMPGMQFSLISPISTNDARYPWCGNFSVDGQPGFDLNLNLFNSSSVCFYTASTFGPSDRLIVSNVLDGLSCVVNPTGYVSHRFIDGGVQLNTSSPYNTNQSVVPNLASLNNVPRESTIIRQTRKYFRYQSGKSIQFSTGILFRPVLEPSTWSVVVGVPVDSQTRYAIQLVFDYDHGMVGYGRTTSPYNTIPYKIPTRVRLSGFESVASPVSTSAALSAWPLLNGDFNVLTSSASNSLIIDLGTNPLLGLPPYSSTASGLPRIEALGWYDATTRTGLFDDQNGMFWEYDGINLNVVRRAATQQLGGKFNPNKNAPNMNGITNVSRLGRAIFPGDAMNIKGQTYYHQIINNASAVTRNFYPFYRGPSTTANSARVSRVVETRVKQSDFNLDKLDGTGPSGYTIDLGKMQMVFIDYSWYGAGKIRYGVRANEGNIIWCHEILNNNVNTEAHMKTGNLPGRFELATRSRPFETFVAPNFQGAGVNAVGNFSPATYHLSAYAADATYLPASGSIFYNNEVVNYIKTNASTLYTELSVTRRWQPGGQCPPRAGFFNTVSQTYGGGFLSYDRAFSINQNCAPTLSHWGTSVIMDGDFNTDKSYLFTAASLSAAVVPPNQEYPLISIRMAPSVDYGVPAAFGVRSQNNRSQLTLDSLGVAVAGQGQLVLRLNSQSTAFAQRLSAWTNVSNGSLAQYFDHSVQEAIRRTPYPVGGEIVGAFFCQQTTGNAFEVTPIDIATTRELGNAILGGDNVHPDGPDVLTVSVRNISTASLNLSAFARITWTESQG